MAFVSCVGFSGPVAFRSGGCSLALDGMAPVCGVTLARQAGALTVVGAGTARSAGSLVACKAPADGRSDLLSARLAATPGSRKGVFACRATRLEGGDSSGLDPEKVSQVSA
jgi:hypothetical protein